MRPEKKIQPHLTENLKYLNDVRALLKEYYNLEAESVQSLNGYDDKNFFVTVNPLIENHYLKVISPHGYVFKIINEDDSKKFDLMNGRNWMVAHLSSTGLNVPLPVPLINGTYWTRTQIKTLQSTNRNDEDSTRMIYLLEYLPGQMMIDVTYTKELLENLGEFVGELYLKLKNFSNDGIKERNLVWNLRSLPQIENFIFVLSEKPKIDLINDVYDAWMNAVLPLLPSLEQGVLHNDINEQNILVSNDRICGLLDFGDVCFSPFLFEIAIAIAYVLVEIETLDLIEAGRCVLAGYLRKRHLTDIEWDIIKECIAGRLAQSLVLGAHSYYKDPSNDYVLCSAKKGWTVLDTFWKIPKQELLQKWKRNYS